MIRTTVFISALFFTATGLAQTPSFESLDSDRNGALDRDELAAAPALRARMLAADTDGSGDLNAEEFAALVVARNAERTNA